MINIVHNDIPPKDKKKLTYWIESPIDYPFQFRYFKDRSSVWNNYSWIKYSEIDKIKNERYIFSTKIRSEI